MTRQTTYTASAITMPAEGVAEETALSGITARPISPSVPDERSRPVRVYVTYAGTQLLPSEGIPGQSHIEFYTPLGTELVTLRRVFDWSQNPLTSLWDDDFGDQVPDVIDLAGIAQPQLVFPVKFRLDELPAGKPNFIPSESDFEVPDSLE